MDNIDRRSAMMIGLIGASGLIVPGEARAETYGPNDGKEIAKGVRQVDLGEGGSMLSAYPKVRLRDIVIQPGAKTPDRQMMNDMVCHMAEGELAVVQNDKQFTVKKGGVWTCAKGITTEGTQNKSDSVAIMRIIDLLTT